MAGAGERSSFCFVHASDLHVGGRRWLKRQPSNGKFRELSSRADRLALLRLIDLCLVEGARFLLCSGDIVDGWCRDASVGFWLVRQLERLRETGCRVALLLGNHDVRTRFMRPLLLPSHAFVLGRGGPETRVLADLGVALHGFSFPELGEGVDVAALYPEPLVDHLNIGLLHTSAEGQNGHARYAPCSRRSLKSHGYDYWALGHVHQRQVLFEAPWIVYPGNLQARGARETGEKGASVVRVENGKIASVEHRALDVVRFETIVVEAEHAAGFDDVLAEARKSALERLTPAGIAVALRLVISGPCAVAAALRVPVDQRARAIERALAFLDPESTWLDEIWLDGGDQVGAFLVDAA